MMEHTSNPIAGNSVLVTGAGGYIGFALCAYLNRFGCRPLALVRPGNAAPPDVDLLTYDMSESGGWESNLEGVDIVFHLASKDYDARSFSACQDVHDNLVPTLRLLEACVGLVSKPRVVFSSTVNIYGKDVLGIIDEGTPPAPITIWAAHQFCCEEYFRTYARSTGLDSVCLRLSNVYGSCDSSERDAKPTINRIAALALGGHDLDLYGNSNCLRDYVQVMDVVVAMVEAGTSTKLPANGEPYIICSGEPLTMKSAWTIIAETARQYTGKDLRLNCRNDIPLDLFEWRNQKLRNELFQSLTGWTPRMSFREGIVKLFDDLKKKQ